MHSAVRADAPFAPLIPAANDRSNHGQVIHTRVPLSPSSITWYRPKGSDAVRTERRTRVWRKVTTAHTAGITTAITCSLTA